MDGGGSAERGRLGGFGRDTGVLVLLYLFWGKLGGLGGRGGRGGLGGGGGIMIELQRGFFELVFAGIIELLGGLCMSRWLAATRGRKEVRMTVKIARDLV